MDFDLKSAVGRANACGGLAYSRDGVDWYLSKEPLYTHYAEIRLDDEGTVKRVRLRYRQRPKIFFDADGTTPLFLYNGAAFFHSPLVGDYSNVDDAYVENVMDERIFTLAQAFNVEKNAALRHPNHERTWPIQHVENDEAHDVKRANEGLRVGSRDRHADDVQRRGCRGDVGAARSRRRSGGPRRHSETRGSALVRAPEPGPESRTFCSSTWTTWGTVTSPYTIKRIGGRY